MKFGFRRPSIKRRIAARTSWKRFARHSLKLKAPKGTGFITNPKKMLYNKVYRKTTVGGEQILSGMKKGNHTRNTSSTGTTRNKKPIPVNKPILDGTSNMGVEDFISKMAKDYEEGR